MQYRGRLYSIQLDKYFLFWPQLPFLCLCATYSTDTDDKGKYLKILLKILIN